MKPGQKVRIKDGTIPLRYAGTTQVIAEVDAEYFGSEIGYRMVGLPKSESGIMNIWREQELELVNDTMTKTEALKAAIDGYKVQCTTWDKGNDNSYVYFNGTHFRFVSDHSGDVAANYSVSYDGWRIYEEPKVQPKFNIGSTIVYRSNRLEKVMAVSDSVPYVYTLANAGDPSSTFSKSEDELRELKEVE